MTVPGNFPSIGDTVDSFGEVKKSARDMVAITDTVHTQRLAHSKNTCDIFNHPQPLFGCNCLLHDINQLFQMDIVSVISTHA